MTDEKMICHGTDVDFDGKQGVPHKPTEMDPVENSVGVTQYVCPNCGVLVE